jgi:hypothetical protein
VLSDISLKRVGNRYEPMPNDAGPPSASAPRRSITAPPSWSSAKARLSNGSEAPVELVDTTAILLANHLIEPEEMPVLRLVSAASGALVIQIAGGEAAPANALCFGGTTSGAAGDQGRQRRRRLR